ncbi:MAG: M23 family metallopeptidase [Anaerolineae bacterium]|nr:M23 family metallopeptidase [Anaerolineae bacterium]
MKRLTFAALVALLCVLSVAPLVAQEATTPPPAAPTVAPLPTRMPRPNPSFTTTVNNATLQLYFPVLPQGSTGLMRVTPNNGVVIANVRARFLNGLIDFFPADDGYYGLISTGMEQPTRKNVQLDVFVTYTDGTRDTVTTTVEITVGAFIRQNVTIGPDKAYLLDIETERNELAQLESVFSTYTEQKMWDETGFQFPISTRLTSPFGAFRTFNGTINTRHTGWDMQAALGTPIYASASGVVAYAEQMQVRGNHVILDHGYGVFTTYSHMIEIHVARGDIIEKGQLIGEVGATGRTSGPHFHWETAVNDNFVDGVQFLEMWMP